MENKVTESLWCSIRKKNEQNLFSIEICQGRLRVEQSGKKKILMRDVLDDKWIEIPKHLAKEYAMAILSSLVHFDSSIKNADIKIDFTINP